MTSKFLTAVEFLLAHEGGYSADPLDPGGETKYGISKQSYPNEDIIHLTIDRAKEIYFTDWWDKYGYERIENAEIAKKLMDMSVNMGQRRAVSLLQRCLNDVWNCALIEDGIAGPNTIKAVNVLAKFDQTDELYRGLCHYQCSYYEGLNQPHFLHGWLRRALA